MDSFTDKGIDPATVQSIDHARVSLNLLEDAFKANEARLNDLRKELNGVADLFKRDFSQSLQKAVQDGKSFTDVFTKTRQALEDLAIKMAVVNPISNLLFGQNGTTTQELGAAGTWAPAAGQGGLAGALLSGMADLLGARAFGGPVATGQPYMVGERGPELFVPQTAGRIMPGQGSGNVQVTMHITTPDAASFRASQTQITAGMMDAARRAQRIR